MRIGRWQLVWWGLNTQGFGVWYYPPEPIDFGNRRIHIFKGWRFGFFEVRYFPRQWENPTPSSGG